MDDMGAADTINWVKRSHDHLLAALATKPWDKGEIHYSTDTELKTELKPNQTDEKTKRRWGEFHDAAKNHRRSYQSLQTDTEKVWNMPQNSERSRPP